MVKPKGLEWNQTQLLIAKAVSEGKTTAQVVQIVGVHEDTVTKVKSAIKHGDKPPSLEPDFIAVAKPPSKFIKSPAPGTPLSGTGETAQEKASETTKPKIDGAPLPGNKPVQKTHALTDSVCESTFLQLVPKVQQITMTPDIFMSYFFAVRSGYTAQIGDWISLCTRDFWFGRGVDFYAGMSGISVGPGDGEKPKGKPEEVPSGHAA